MKQLYNISILIPVYNEEGLLQSSIIELVEKMKELPLVYEIIICENGSRDNTRELAGELIKKYRNVRLLSINEPNYGKALKQGILAARGEIVICEEVDICNTKFYKHAINEITTNDYDLVIGSKLHPQSKDKRPFFRHFATIFITFLLRILFGFKGSDTHGLKAFKRQSLIPIVKKCVCDKDIFASEFVLRAEKEGKKILEVPVEIVEKRKPSINLLKRVPNVLKNLLKLFWILRVKKR